MGPVAHFAPLTRSHWHITRERAGAESLLLATHLEVGTRDHVSEGKSCDSQRGFVRAFCVENESRFSWEEGAPKVDLILERKASERHVIEGTMKRPPRTRSWSAGSLTLQAACLGGELLRVLCNHHYHHHHHGFLTTPRRRPGLARDPLEITDHHLCRW